jgi:hypothetical protein
MARRVAKGQGPLAQQTINAAVNSALTASVATRSVHRSVTHVLPQRKGPVSMVYAESLPRQPIPMMNAYPALVVARSGDVPSTMVPHA